MAKARRNSEADIIDEIGAVPSDPDDPTSVLVADEEKIREAGAIDTESIRANRITRETIDRKNNGEKHVAFNDPNLLLRYEDLGKFWPHNTISILVKRLTGTPMQDMITSQPRSAGELFAALKALHGRREETMYELIFRDTLSQERRGGGQITMPSTLEPPQVSPPGYQPAYSPQTQTPQTQQPPVVQVMPSPPLPPTDPFAMIRQFLEMQQMMQRHQQGQPVAAIPSPAPVGMQDNSTLQAMQMFEMWRAMQPQQQPQMQQPQQVAPPPPPPPPNPLADPFAMMKGMIEVARMMQPPPPAPSPPSPPMRIEDEFYAPARPRGSSAYGPRPQGYGPRPQSYDRSQAYNRTPPYEYGQPSQYGPPQPPTRPKSAVEEFREATSVIRTAINIANEFTGQNPQQQASESPLTDDDDNPVRVLDVAGTKVLINKDDGSFRAWESGLANLDKIFKFAGDQFEKLQKNAVAAQQQKQQQAQQLPPGYVEMTPGYQPPPGFVAIPVDQIPQHAQPAQTLPAPPTNLPPPISEVQSEESRPAWGMPDMPGDER